MAHVAKNAAIPMRDGVSPSCVALPRMRVPPWPTLLDYLAERLPTVSREAWAERMNTGEVVDDQGRPLTPEAPYENGARVYYWRSLPQEPDIPFHETIVFQDEHLVVADKPHFLPVTPGGRYVQQSLLVRLKKRLNLPNLSPLHRIDRETAGLVMFSVRPQDRDAYQRLFRERLIDKTYEAIAPHRPDMTWPVTRRSHILEQEDAFYKMREALPHEGLSNNSETHIHLIEQQGAWARYRLEPVTGKRHQLRVHMNALGLPLLGDQFYPVVQRAPGELEDFGEPLRLLARAMSFTDPVTGVQRRFESRLALSWPATAG
jgi:tRNA pseudouridine32 synthase / 23S rRNA pseudouridine746 synthase